MFGDGWCRRTGVEPGGPKGVVCDVVPDGLDLIGWFGAGLVVIIATGFYLWHWPNVRRWATALVIKRGRGRFQFHLSLHKVVGLVVSVPLHARATPETLAIRYAYGDCEVGP